jgi:hypothetical protein
MKTIEIDIKSNKFDSNTIQIVRDLINEYTNTDTKVIISLIIDNTDFNKDTDLM